VMARAAPFAERRYFPFPLAAPPPAPLVTPFPFPPAGVVVPVVSVGVLPVVELVVPVSTPLWLPFVPELPPVVPPLDGVEGGTVVDVCLSVVVLLTFLLWPERVFFAGDPVERFPPVAGAFTCPIATALPGLP